MKESSSLFIISLPIPYFLPLIFFTIDLLCAARAAAPVWPPRRDKCAFPWSSALPADGAGRRAPAAILFFYFVAAGTPPTHHHAGTDSLRMLACIPVQAAVRPLCCHGSPARSSIIAQGTARQRRRRQRQRPLLKFSMKAAPADLGC